MKRFLHKYLLSILAYGIITIAALIVCGIIYHDVTRQNDWEAHRTIIETPIGWGDTLNEIACKYKPSFMSINEYTYHLRELNDMTDSMLYAGQSLKVYVYTEGGAE